MIVLASLFYVQRINTWPLIWLCVLFRIEYENNDGFFSCFEFADYSNVYRSNILPIDRSHMHGDLLIIDFESIFDRTNSQLKSIDENLIGNPVSSSMPKLLHWPNSKRMCIDLKRSNESPCAHNEHEKHRENVWKREIENILSNGG